MTASKAPARTLTAVGIACLIMAAAGFWYSSGSLTGESSDTLDKLYDVPHFQTIFYILSGICLSFYTLLAITGIQLIRTKTNWVFVLLGIIMLELIYTLILGRLVASAEYGHITFTTSAITSGGLVVQWISLFSLWAPITAFWARSRLRKTS